MRIKTALGVASAAALALAVAAPVTEAATPFTAGVGDNPVVAVGADGSGHVVWTTIGEENTRVGYCRIGAGAEACNRTELLNFGSASAASGAGRAMVFAPAPGRVVVIGHCNYCGPEPGAYTYRWVSNDNGSSFGPPSSIGRPGPNGSHGFGTWLDAAAVFVGARGNEVRAMQTVADAGSIQYTSGGSFLYDSQVVQVPGEHKLVAAVNDLRQIRYGVYTGGASTPAGINDETNWLVNRSLPSAEADNGHSALNAGPNGVFLTYSWDVVGNPRLGLRRFDSTTNVFGAPSYIAGGAPLDRDVRDPDSFQDAAGRVHAVWGTLYDRQRLRYTVSDTSVSSFAPAANLAVRESFHEMEIAAGADGRGFVAWTNGAYGNVRVVPIDPQPEPAAPPAGGGGAPPPGSSAPPPPGPATTAPPTYSGPLRPTTVRLAGGSITFTTPRTCVAPGQTYRVTLRFKRKKRKGNVFVKIHRTDFYVGTRRVKIDRKAPFARRFVVGTSAQRGSTIRLRARAFIKVRRGRSPKKSIWATIRVCE